MAQKKTGCQARLKLYQRLNAGKLQRARDVRQVTVARPRSGRPRERRNRRKVERQL